MTPPASDGYGYDLMPELGPVDSEPEQRRRAARTIAAFAHDARDAAWLLAALALDAAEGQT